MAKSLSVADVKATLSERVRDVENGQTVVITRHGRAVAALVPVEDMEHLARLRAARPEGGLASLVGGWEGADELVRILDASPRIGQREILEPD